MNLEKMPRRLKMELAFLYHLADMSIAEIAEKLGVSEGTVNSWARANNWKMRTEAILDSVSESIQQMAESIVRQRIELARKAIQLTDVTLQIISQELGVGISGKDLIRAAEVVATIADKHSRIAETLIKLERQAELEGVRETDERKALVAAAAEWAEEEEDEIEEEMDSYNPA